MTAQTAPVDAGGTDDEETHETTWTRFPGHVRCTCGYVGTEDMMSRHMSLVGWCPDCWGSGSSPYWLDGGQGLCRTCLGSGEMDSVRRLDRDDATRRLWWRRGRAQRILDRRQVRA